MIASAKQPHAILQLLCDIGLLSGHERVAGPASDSSVRENQVDDHSCRGFAMTSMDWSAQVGDGPTNYQEFLVPGMFTPFAGRLIADLKITPGSAVLDVACGTGVWSDPDAVVDESRDVGTECEINRHGSSAEVNSVSIFAYSGAPAVQVHIVEGMTKNQSSALIPVRPHSGEVQR